jgi:hypothetical protein
MCRGSSVSTVTDWKTGIKFPVRAMIGFSLFASAFRPVLGSTQHPTQLVSGILTPGVRRPGVIIHTYLVPRLKELSLSTMITLALVYWVFLNVLSTVMNLWVSLKAGNLTGWTTVSFSRRTLLLGLGFGDQVNEFIKILLSKYKQVL